MPAWISAIRSRCSISRSARRFDIASHRTATPAKIINEKTLTMTCSSDTPASMRPSGAHRLCIDGDIRQGAALFCFSGCAGCFSGCAGAEKQGGETNHRGLHSNTAGGWMSKIAS